MSIPGGLELCAFDAYGTLLDIKAMIERFRPDLGHQAEPFFKMWRSKQLEISWLFSPSPKKADFWQVTREALDVTMETFNLYDTRLLARMMEAWLSPPLYREVPGVLAQLRSAGIKTAIVSNGTRKMLTAGIAAAGLDSGVDAVLSAEEAGVFKPKPAVYQMAVDHFDIAPQLVCFVSGNIWDIHGAAAFGFNVVWVNRAAAPPENLPAGRAETIATLAELPALLGA